MRGPELNVLSRAWAWAGVLGSACSQAWAGCPGMSVVSGPEHGLRPVKERGLDGRRGLRPGWELGSQTWFEGRGFGPEHRLRPGSSLGLGLDWAAGLGGRVLDFCMVSGCRLGSWAQRDLRPQAWAGARVLSSVYSLGLGRGDGHLGVTLIKFASNQSGLLEAMRLAEYFEKDDHGWLAVLKSNGLGDCSCPCRFEAGSAASCFLPFGSFLLLIR
ncbi:hypothetical protein CQW23_22249 [Capsicum baccatum]|uniref:XS domain-containing protein n=1 Tax=Capsicum baccatum TaxID=33114 RepID=A0A2G2W0B7_CAPBA|nr:hypothetical protein CQW23_22249 [Capsicum baccatum]